MWYDGLWLNHDPETDRSGYCATFWRAQELETMARSLQPGLLINNRSGVAADFSTPEGRVLPPAEKDRAWEACMTMGAAWGHVADPDPMLMTVPQLVKNLFDCAKDAGNYLLNCAVKPFPVLEFAFDGEPRVIDEATNRAAWLDGTLPTPA